MQNKQNLGMWTRVLVLIGAALLLLASVRGHEPGGMQLAVDGQGLSFELRTAFINIAFDIGQSRPKTDTLRNLLG